ncbi:cobalamin biosynthesis protein CbiD [Sesbania bispinosa]|nr:cobalamin biosynthesis protein CbiD [Sesbania bispinosa]
MHILGLGRTQPRRYCGAVCFHDNGGRMPAKTRSKLLESKLPLGGDEAAMAGAGGEGVSGTTKEGVGKAVGWGGGECGCVFLWTCLIVG